jgi:hypothetical protein
MVESCVEHNNIIPWFMCCAIFFGATHIYNMNSSLFACCCIILFFNFTVTEMMGPTKRLIASFCVYFAFCIGNYILLSMAFLIRDWRVLYWAITVPMGSYIIALLWVNNLIKIRSHSHPPIFFINISRRGDQGNPNMDRMRMVLCVFQWK